MRLLSVPVTLPADDPITDVLVEPRERRVRHEPTPASASYICQVCDADIETPDAHADPDFAAYRAERLPASRPFLVVLAEALGIDLFLDYLAARHSPARKAHA